MSVFGDYLRAHRTGNKLSMGKLAKAIGFSVPYISDVELGRRGSMDRRVWPALVKAIPTMDLAALELATLMSGRVWIDLSKATDEDRFLWVCFMRRLEGGMLPKERRAIEEALGVKR